jgi:hypothetical protein
MVLLQLTLSRTSKPTVRIFALKGVTACVCPTMFPERARVGRAVPTTVPGARERAFPSVDPEVLLQVTGVGTAVRAATPSASKRFHAAVNSDVGFQVSVGCAAVVAAFQRAFQRPFAGV